jgi:hypothetical protein
MVCHFNSHKKKITQNGGAIKLKDQSTIEPPKKRKPALSLSPIDTLVRTPSAEATLLSPSVSSPFSCLNTPSSTAFMYDSYPIQPYSADVVCSPVDSYYSPMQFSFPQDQQQFYVSPESSVDYPLDSFSYDYPTSAISHQSSTEEYPSFVFPPPSSFHNTAPIYDA